MGYAQALLAKDTSAEQAKLEKQARRKGLFGSIGRMVGSFLPALVPGLGWAAKAAVSGLGSLAGGAVGSAAAGKLSEGKFFQADRKSLEREINPFGMENITGAFTTAITKGMGEKMKALVAGGGRVVTDPTAGISVVADGKAPGFFQRGAWIEDAKAFEESKVGKLFGYESPHTRKWGKSVISQPEMSAADVMERRKEWHTAEQAKMDVQNRAQVNLAKSRAAVPIASEETVDEPFSDLGTIKEPEYQEINLWSPHPKPTTELSAKELGFDYSKIDRDPYASSYGQTDAEFLGMYSDEELQDLYTSPHSRSLLAQEAGFGGGQFVKDQPVTFPTEGPGPDYSIGKTFGRFANPPGGVRQSTLDLLRGGDPNSLLNQWNRGLQPWGRR